jgi:hypothetical protein
MSPARFRLGPSSAARRLEAEPKREAEAAVPSAGRAVPHGSSPELDASVTETRPGRARRPRMVDEHAPHDPRRHRQEVHAILECEVEVDDPRVRLVHDRGRLEGVIHTLVAHVRRRDAPQLRVDRLRELRCAASRAASLATSSSASSSSGESATSGVRRRTPSAPTSSPPARIGTMRSRPSSEGLAHGSFGTRHSCGATAGSFAPSDPGRSSTTRPNPKLLCTCLSICANPAARLRHSPHQPARTRSRRRPCRGRSPASRPSRRAPRPRLRIRA